MYVAYSLYGIVSNQSTCMRRKCDNVLCVVVEQILGGAVSERIAGSAYCSVWNVVSSQRHRGGLGGREPVLD